MRMVAKAQTKVSDPDIHVATNGRPEVAHLSKTSEILDQTMARVARLEAALAITGGTVHDVNNLLTILSGNLFMLTELVRDQRNLYEKVRVARNTAEKCGALMRELLTFSRNSDEDSQIICPANHVTALEPLLKRSIKTDHKLHIRTVGDPWSVDASPTQFESAVTNIVINARDALGVNGIIQMTVLNKTVDAKRARELGVSSGQYVCVRVADNGCGIPARDLPRIVEPLFTTKDEGHGTGLGLSMVNRFAEQHCGALRIRSKEGIGTDVRIWLPRSEQQAEVTANMTLPLSTLKGGDETAILASRDSEVRAAIQDILQALGYTVVLAAMGKPLTLDHLESQAAVILVCDRTEQHRRAEHVWIDTLRRANHGLRQVAILAPDADVTEIAPDADAHLFRPVAVIELARVMRAAMES